MKFYVLRKQPPEDGVGSDDEEWFSSLKAAKDRRSELLLADVQRVVGRIRRWHMEPGNRYYDSPTTFKFNGEEVVGYLSIDRYEVSKSTTKQLLLKVLNRSGWAREIVEVVPELTRRDYLLKAYLLLRGALDLTEWDTDSVHRDSHRAGLREELKSVNEELKELRRVA